MSSAATEPPRTRGYKKKARTRARLLQAAIEVIAERGESFSVSDVAERAEVANGTFYNYFPDRDALLDAVVPEMMSAFADQSAEAVVEDDPVLRFATITALALRGAETNPLAMQAMLRLDRIQAALVDLGPLHHLRDDLALGVASGRFVIADEDAALDVVVGGLAMALRRRVEQRAGRGHQQAVLVHLLRSLGVSDEEAASTAVGAIEAADRVAATHTSG